MARTRSDPNAAASPRSARALRAPRLAEMVADVLRERIVSGELVDGGKLPRQEDLIEEFSVSKPSMREALRILETEGLISVRRGKLGGAIVHAPQSQDAAYMLGLVLQAKHVPIADVGSALLNLEPACAVLCGERDDRAEVVAALRTVHEEGVAARDDPVAFATAMRRFHEAIVDSCGNDTLQTVVGSLQTLWSSKEPEWLESAAATGAVPSRDARLAMLREHARLLAAIDKGDTDGIARVAYRHECITHSYALAASSPDEVDAADARRTTTP